MFSEIKAGKALKKPDPLKQLPKKESVPRDIGSSLVNALKKRNIVLDQEPLDPQDSQDPEWV